MFDFGAKVGKTRVIGAKVGKTRVIGAKVGKTRGLLLFFWLLGKKVRHA